MSLFIVSIPIGHPDDITLRAIQTLKEVDFLICEEFKIGRKLLKQLNIKKELFSLNEHNETEATDEIINLLLQPKNAAIFSDCGTPIFADPGTYLVNRCYDCGIEVISVPGASSLTSALAVAGVEIPQFYYAGFLPRKTEARCQEIKRLKNFSCPVIIFDTPYRISALLKDLCAELTSDRRIVLLLSLTKPDAQIIRGSIPAVIKQWNRNPCKKEFVLILEPVIKSSHVSRKRSRNRKRYK